MERLAYAGVYASLCCEGLQKVCYCKTENNDRFGKVVKMKCVDKYIVQKTYSLEKTMKVINENAKGFALVCEDKRLWGIVTDGDIRRYLLAGGTLEKNICCVANKEPCFVMEKERYLAEMIMEKEKLTVMPIINENHELTDIIFEKPDLSDTEKENLGIPLVIMAGGKGTRLRPYTDILPKPLIPVEGITITEQIMNRFSEYGCDDVYIIVNYMKNFIKSYFNEKEVRQNIHFIEEEHFLGTGGGLQYLKGMINEPFFMTNCDVLLDCDYAEILRSHKMQQNIITMICAKKKQTIPYGTIEIGEDDQIFSMKEKPTIEYNINTGVYLIEPDFLDLIPENESIHLPQLIDVALEKSKRAGAYLIDESQWMDMGQMEELEQMKNKIEQFKE